MKKSNPYTIEKLVKMRSYAPSSGPLHEANQGFHEIYNQLVDESLDRLGRQVPVVVISGSHLHLLYGGQTVSERFISDQYHRLKAFSHMAFGVQLALTANGEGALSRVTEGRLQVNLPKAQKALESLPGLNFSVDVRQAMEMMLERSISMIEEVLSRSEVKMEDVAAFCRSIAPFMTRGASLAVRLELDSLHNIVLSWRRGVVRNAWANLYVVICGGHQPRYREAAKQYFQHLLHEREGPGAEFENRVLYAEALPEVSAALDLLARHIIDQKASMMFFGNHTRLQKDMLADVAAEYIQVLLPDN